MLVDMDIRRRKVSPNGKLQARVQMPDLLIARANWREVEPVISAR